VIREIQKKDGFIVDMDGVLYDGGAAIPGAREFLTWLQKSGKRFLLLTNSSDKLPIELSRKINRITGLQIGPENFYTSALSTARWLGAQTDREKTAYVIGDPGLVQALYEEGFAMDDVSPSFVVVGETKSLNYEMMATAINLVRKGASFVATNLDFFDKMFHNNGPPAPSGSTVKLPINVVPSTGTIAAPIAAATGVKPFFLGKPNPLMMRIALQRLGVPRENAIVIGDRMDTDILAGVESEIDTILVLSGVTDSVSDLHPYAYRPKYYFSSLGQLLLPGDSS